MVALAKISPPHLVNIYPRQRLFELLDHKHQSQVIWVSGPPGAGKTTFIASYLATHSLPAPWYRLDVGDSDLATFFYYLDQAVRQTATRKRKPLPLFSPEHRLDLQTFSRRYLRELYNCLHDPFVIVFDNYQELAADSPVHEVVKYALEEIPSHGRIILISRSEPPVQFARLQANSLMRIIDHGDMRLSGEEARGIACQRVPHLMHEQQFDVFLETIQGWAAGLVLLCESCRHLDQYQPAIEGTSHQTIFDYFAGEILGRADDEMRDVLITSALLPNMPGPLARRLTGHDLAAGILEELAERNYFTTRDAQGTFQFHPLFREFLLVQAKQTMAPSAIAKRLRKAAQVYTASGQTEAAVELWLEVNDWEQAARCALACAPMLFAQGRHTTLIRWIERLPVSVQDASPWLLYWNGMATLPFDPADSQRTLTKAHVLFLQQDDKVGLLRSWAGATMSIWVDGTGDYKRLDSWIAELDRIIPGLSGLPSPQVEGEVAYSAFAAMFFRAPRHPMIELWRDRAISLSRAHANINQHIGALVIAIHYDLMRGDSARASLSVDAIAALGAKDEQLEPAIRIRRFSALSYYQARTGEFEAALGSMAAGLEASRISGVHLWDYQLYSHGVNAALMMGDTTLAGSLLERMGRDPRVASGFAGALYHINASWHKLSCGDTVAALAHSGEAITIAEESGVARGAAYRSYATVLSRQHKFAEARDYLQKSIQIARNDANLQHEFMGLMLEAHCDFAEGNDEQAYTYLRKGLVIGREQQIVSSLAWDNDIMTRLCCRALESGIEPDYTRRIIRVCKLPPQSLTVSNWPWRLKLHTLGRFTVLKNDSPLRFSGKAPKKLIALLKAIVALGGREVPNHSLIDALWSDQEADAAHEAFDVALRRLRKLLGEEVIAVSEGRVTLDGRYVWVDTWTFEHLLAKAEAISNEGKPDTADIECALDLYHGAFLAGDPEAFWSLSTRERLRSKFIRYSTVLGNTKADDGEWEKALSIYLSGIDADSLSEELYQGAMRCYQQLGRNAEALAVYRRLRQTLSITLGIKPSATSENLYQTLIAG